MAQLTYAEKYTMVSNAHFQERMRYSIYDYCDWLVRTDKSPAYETATYKIKKQAKAFLESSNGIDMLNFCIKFMSLYNNANPEFNTEPGYETQLSDTEISKNKLTLKDTFAYFAGVNDEDKLPKQP